MSSPVAPIVPHLPNGPARVIQGFFPGGKPRIIQASPAWAPVAPSRTAPAQAKPAPLLPSPLRPGAVQSIRPGVPQPIQPKTARNAAPPPILPKSSQPATLQPSAGHALALPPGFVFTPSNFGQKLPEAVQQKMEAFFSTSFADVRIHVGPAAASIGALAFTHGTDLYFAPGQYNPQTTEGQQLLGHELTHVVQQRAGRVRNPLGTGVAVVQDPALEAEAERMGMRASLMPAQVQPKLGSLPRATVAQRVSGTFSSSPPTSPHRRAQGPRPHFASLDDPVQLKGVVQLKCGICGAKSHNTGKCPKGEKQEDASSGSGRGLSKGGPKELAKLEACIEAVMDKTHLLYGKGAKSVAGGYNGAPTGLDDTSARIDRQGAGNVQFQVGGSSLAAVTFSQEEDDVNIIAGLRESFRTGAIVRL
jgi:Domain of unknown function (DUF4157)